MEIDNGLTELQNVTKLFRDALGREPDGALTVTRVVASPVDLEVDIDNPNESSNYDRSTTLFITAPNEVTDFQLSVRRISLNAQYKIIFGNEILTCDIVVGPDDETAVTNSEVIASVKDQFPWVDGNVGVVVSANKSSTVTSSGKFTSGMYTVIVSPDVDSYLYSEGVTLTVKLNITNTVEH